MESYTAQLGEIYEIALIQPAADTDNAETAEKAAHTESTEKKYGIPMVMANDKLYYDTDHERTADMRCGSMDSPRGTVPS